MFVGFWKKATGKQTMTWSQAVDQALCFGWIDGVMRRIDDERHMQRFTPRKPGSNWSKVNVEKVARLEAAGLMTDAGREGVRGADEDKTGVYSFESERRGRAAAGVRRRGSPRTGTRTSTSRRGRRRTGARPSTGS